jgi:hypothetical protein
MLLALAPGTFRFQWNSGGILIIQSCQSPRWYIWNPYQPTWTAVLLKINMNTVSESFTRRTNPSSCNFFGDNQIVVWIQALLFIDRSRLQGKIHGSQHFDISNTQICSRHCWQCHGEACHDEDLKLCTAKSCFRPLFPDENPRKSFLWQSTERCGTGHRFVVLAIPIQFERSHFPSKYIWSKNLQ